MTTTQKESRIAWRGFASMSQERRSAIARLGGQAAWAKGTAHRWTIEEAQRAGRLGGAKSRRRRSATRKETL